MSRSSGAGLALFLFLAFNSFWSEFSLLSSKHVLRLGLRPTTTKNETIAEDSMENRVDLLRPRAFQRWMKGHSSLCEQPPLPDDERVFSQGLLYLRPTKTGSSTASGINLRIARNIARRLKKEFRFCRASFRHRAAFTSFKHRDPDRSFLWTVIRDPTKRAQSEFFHFQVSRENVSASDENFVRYLQSPKVSQHYRHKLPFKAWKKNEPANQTQAIMQAVLDRYNFIGITERFDESLVVLQMLLDLPVDDILYLNAKSSGGYDDGRYNDKCFFIVPKFRSPGMKEYFDSQQWKETIRFENAVYIAANRSLDLTIDALGRDVFAKKLTEFRTAQALAVETCEANAVFPCLASGEKSAASDQDCLYADSGCGDSCLTKVAEKLRREREKDFPV